MTQNNLQSITNNDLNLNEKFEDFEAEIAVIGCLLWDNKSYEKIADFLTEEHFYDLNNNVAKAFNNFYLKNKNQIKIVYIYRQVLIQKV